MAEPAAESSQPEKPNNNRGWGRIGGYFNNDPRRKWVLLSIVVLGLVVGAWLWHYFSIRETTDDAQIDGHINPISAKVNGTVLTVNVNDNQEVKAGDVLFTLDPKDYRLALEKAEADLANARAEAQAAQVSVPVTNTTTGSTLTASEAGVKAAEKRVDAARARLEAARAKLAEAEADHEKAARDRERASQLLEKDEVSQQSYDAAVAAEKSSAATVAARRADVAEAQQNLELARSRLTQARAEHEAAGTAPQQVTIARARSAAAAADVQQAQAAVDQAKLNLDYTVVRAPVDGLVSSKTVEVGQVISAGQPVLALVPLGDIWVTANFKETQLADMRPGQRARIKVDAYGHTYDGHVDSIAAATGEKFSLLPPENATGNYVKVVQRVPVKIVFEKGQDPQHRLRPGMSVVPTVFTQ